MTILPVWPMAAFIAAGAAFHFYWGFGGQTGRRVAVPQRLDGTPLFEPTRAATLAVAVGLSLVLVALAAYAMQLDLGLPRGMQRIGMVALGLIFSGRGLAWHPYVGLFKTVRTTDFARNDTWLYSPGCVVTGLGFLLLAWEG